MRHSGKTIAFGASMLVLGALSLTATSHAQEDDTSANESRRMQTVTVTSTKREQTLQDVPVAVSVVDEETIEKAEIQDLSDLQTLVPSLRVNTFQSAAQTSFNIRGFGNGDNNAGVEPSVGVFVDGVYRSRSAAQIADLPNLERVEVLRGPQSTLFGKNASAGVISIITQAPQFTPSGSVSATLGNYNLKKLSGDVTGPITDSLAFSLAGGFNVRDGYAEDLISGEDLNDRDRWNVRGQLLFAPNDDLSVRIIGDYSEIDEICCIGANVTTGPTGPAIFALGGQIDVENPFSYKTYINYLPSNEIENYGVSGEINYEFDNNITLTSITALRNTGYIQDADGDFTSADTLGQNYSDTQIETFTQELRLTSNEGERFDWMLGAFYFDETVEINNELSYGADFRGYADILSGGALAQVETLLGLPVGATFGQDGQGYSEQFGQDNQAWSIFGTVDAYITDKLTATVGINYTHDEKDAFGDVIATDVFSALDFVGIGNNVIYQTAFAQTLAGFGINPMDPAQVQAFANSNPAAFAQIQAGAQAFADANDENPAVNSLLGLQPLQFLPPFVNFPNAVESGQSEDEAVTYTLRLSYDLTDDINIYGSYATGFKATSWNLSRDSRPFAADIPALRNAGLGVPNLNAGTRYAGPEDSKVYEIGLKAQFDTVSLNLALFDQQIEDFQSNVFTGTGFALTNAGAQSSTGVEVDLVWSPIEGLNLSYGALFMDPVFDDYPNSPSGDLTGARPEGVSDSYMSIGASYDFTLPNEWDAYVRADYQHESEADLSYDNDPRQTREIDTVNASLGVETQNGLRVSVWGRNIFNDEYLIQSFPSTAQQGSITGYPSQPATYGITLTKDF
ncbi:MAG: TonB-dependent receptor [Ponticaulis sp.]|nr:TonB-dependent receptor [Ponticaulis sp.]